jgi:hypothetical protein
MRSKLEKLFFSKKNLVKKNIFLEQVIEKLFNRPFPT